MTEEQNKEFSDIAKSAIEWLCNNCNPHTKIIIDCTSAELVSGERSVVTDEFVKD